MENSKSMSDPCSQQDAGTAGAHHTQLRDAIINRLEQISERSQEQVLEYIQELIDEGRATVGIQSPPGQTL